MKSMNAGPLLNKLCAPILLATLAFAQPATAAPSVKEAAKRVDVATIHLFAGCVTDKYRQSVRRLLTLDYRTKAYDHALQTLTDASRSCIPFAYGRMTSAGVLLAGAFAEKMLPKMLDGAPLADRVAYVPGKPPVAARDDGEYLGLCVVRTMPAQVTGLLATKPASADEKAAVAGITSGLGPCLRAGAQAKINVPGLRAIVALAAYRLAAQAGS